MFTFFVCFIYSNGPLKKHRTGFPQQVQNIMSVCCNWLILTHVIYFNKFLIDNQLSRNVLLFSCNTIGQLCLGDPSYSSHTVKAT